MAGAKPREWTDGENKVQFLSHIDVCVFFAEKNFFWELTVFSMLFYSTTLLFMRFSAPPRACGGAVCKTVLSVLFFAQNGRKTQFLQRKSLTNCVFMEYTVLK